MTDVPDRRSFFALSTVETLFAWFQRLVAAYSLVFGVHYWVRIVGYYEGDLWRFDLMPVYWQIVSVTLSAFFPFAAIGLWMLASWGPVIWFICAATETVMYVGFPGIFGTQHLVVATHLFTACLYGTFRVVMHLQRRRLDLQG